MGAFKDSYYEDKEQYMKELTEDYTNQLIKNGYVLDDADLDYDNVQEDDEPDNDDCVYTDIDVMDESEINEMLFKKIVIRQGKKIKKWFSSDPRKKVQPNPDGKGKPKEVVKKVKEKIARKKGSLRGKIKRKAQASQIKLHSKLSRLKRKIFGIH